MGNIIARDNAIYEREASIIREEYIKHRFIEHIRDDLKNVNQAVDQAGEETFQARYIYHGIFQNNQLVKGYINIKGLILEGTFMNGYLVEGEIYDDYGLRLEGKFVDGLLIEGTFEIIGLTYIGKFVDMHLVEGKCIDATGREDVGTFKDDKLIEGVITYPDGVVKKGKFDKGYILLEGKITYCNDDSDSDCSDDSNCSDNSDVYTEEGKFIDEQLVEGKVTYADGMIEEGKFIDEQLVEGKVIYSDGQIEEGKFIDEILVEGKVTFPNGNTSEGTFDIETSCLKEGTRYVDGVVTKGTYIDGYFASGIITYANGDSAVVSIMDKEQKIIMDGLINMQTIYKGILNYASGTSIKGTFRLMSDYTLLAHGQCLVTYHLVDKTPLSGDSYFGEFVMGVKDGSGTCYRDGIEYIQNWCEGRCVGTIQHKVPDTDMVLC
jgi:hypothetical protein